MSEEVGPAQIARLWTRAIAAEFLAPLQAETEACLDRIPWIAAFPDRDLALAALMTRLVSRYVYGSTPDDLISELKDASKESGDSMPDEDAHQIVMIAVLIAHTGALPFPRWWKPILHAEHFAIACAREALGEGLDPAPLVGEQLMFPISERDRIIEIAGFEPGVEFAIDRDAAGQLAERLESQIGMEAAGEVLKKALLATHEALGERDDLAFATAQIAQLRAALKGSIEDGDKELDEFIKTELKRMFSLMKGLSHLERDLMREVEPAEQLLMDAAVIARGVFTVSREMVPTGLPDLIDGERELPRGLEHYFGLAGQSYQHRAGAIISWSVTFERVLPDGFDRDGPLLLGIGFVEENDTEFLVEVTYEGEKTHSHIYYPTYSATASLALAVLALSQAVRLDFFVLSGERTIEHVAQRALVLEGEIQEHLFARAVERCGPLLADGRDGVIAKLQEERSGKDAPLIAFLMNDSGKSEQLRDVLSPSAALGPGQSTEADKEIQLTETRRRLLDSEAKRIENPSEDTRAEAERESAAYIAEVQRLRSPHERTTGPDSGADLDRILEGVASERRAVVHLTIDSKGLELAWADRASGETEVELLNCEEIDLAELGEALSDPQEGSVLVLDAPGGAGAQLGERIAAHAAERGVDRLLVCPTRNLHRLPVHALRCGDGDKRLIDGIEVAYAPSAAVVAELAALQSRPGPGLVVAESGDLDYGDAEAVLVARLSEAEELLTGERATAPAVLEALGGAARFHLCSHGDYEPRDYLASGFSMPSAAEPDAFLSAARILATADLKGMDLAVLGACQSGAGHTEPSTLDVPGGLDTTFLAAGVRNVLSALWEIDDLGALLFHAEFHRRLAGGEGLYPAYRGAVDLLRSGAWRQVSELELGTYLSNLGIDLNKAFAELEPGDDGDGGIDFADLHHWAAYRVCGVAELDPGHPAT